MSKGISNITDFIPYGKENAVHIAELASTLNIKTAAVKKLVQTARRSGAVILSDTSGYWQSTDQAEIDAYIKSTRKQAISRFTTLKGIKLSEAERNGQMNLADVHRELNNREYESGESKTE
jgi:biotin operon repressor